MAVNVGGLILAVALNWYAALHIGLAGAAMGSVIVMCIDRVITLWRISFLTGVPIRQLQDWKTLALLALFSIVASLLAWAVSVLYFAGTGPIVRILVGGVVLVSGYAAMVTLSGTSRTWLSAVRSRQHEL